jgi:hypothetical protein
MENEKLIFDIVARSRSRARGDVSDVLKQQGFFGKPKGTNEYNGKRDNKTEKSLSKRDDLTTGNPIDIKREFFQQQKN